MFQVTSHIRVELCFELRQSGSRVFESIQEVSASDFYEK